jgi:putative cardiolipin synthase
MKLGWTGRALRLALIAALVSGCASIDYDYPRVESRALSDTEDTELGQLVQSRLASRPNEEIEQRYSGFYPMVNGMDALALRLALAEKAERSIDAQYYLIKNDIVGRAFVYFLLKAADRGVRVRLLVDDMFTAGMDVGVAALDSHPNFSIRIFNPFNRGALGRPMGAITSFNRINRRMHNKSFTVDNQVTIIGGRNIADEYFGARKDAKFGDLDVLGVGPVVQDISNMFDTYWNHEAALPALAFVREPEDPEAALAELRTGLEAALEEIRGSEYADAVTAKFETYMAAEGSKLTWAPFEVVVDSPDKGIKKKAEDAASITTPLIESLSNAKTEAIIVSPYFVPRKRGIEGFRALTARGVDVTIVTNSLAANNQFTVHAGYAGSRKPLLESGVHIWEVRPDADVAGAEIVAAVGAKATLHTKAFVVDQREVFIGSFNFDPRSANINTELGVIIRDEELAERFTNWARTSMPLGAYEVFLNEDNKVRWRDLREDPPIVFEKEPESSWWDRSKVNIIKIFPVKSQL